MLYEINNNNIDNFIKIVNENIRSDETNTHHLVVYNTRTVKPYIKVLVCSKKEWLLFYQFSISSEYMQGNIDVICDTDIDKHTLSLIQSELTSREEYLYEKNKINSIYFDKLTSSRMQ